MRLVSRFIIALALALAAGAALAHAEGVDFLMEGTTSTNDQEFAAPVGDLMNRGVTVESSRSTGRPSAHSYTPSRRRPMGRDPAGS